jgi:hypothetical protein
MSKYIARQQLGTKRVAIRKSNGAIMPLRDGSYVPDVQAHIEIQQGNTIFSEALDDIRMFYRFEMQVTHNGGLYDIYFLNYREIHWTEYFNTDEIRWEIVKAFASMKEFSIEYTIQPDDFEEDGDDLHLFHISRREGEYPVYADTLTAYALSRDAEALRQYFQDGGIFPQQAIENLKELL